MNSVLPLFPSLTHHCEVKEFGKIKKKLVNYVYQENKKDWEGVVRSNVGGWHSRSDYQAFDNIIHSTLLFTLNEYFSKREIFRDNVTFDIGELWININKKNDSNDSHNHPLSDMSGVFWIKVPENSGVLEFHNPNSFQQYKLLKSCYSDELIDKSLDCIAYWFPPREGSIILFPSHLFHSVKPNKSNEERISVSFNLVLNK